ncbi:MAG: type secretion system protein VasG [Acidobacteriota bacterium]|jgi:type VI secretion system protein VasG|nr:type secretion system protein VasG [Acidobacteriota bacterium]
MNINLKSLIDRLDTTCRTALEAAAGMCQGRTNYDVELEHFLIKLVEAQDTDSTRILRYYEVDEAQLLGDLTNALDRLKSGNTRTPSLSPRLLHLIEEAWLLASVNYGSSKIRSGHLILAILTNGDLARFVREISKEFNEISVESLKENLPKLTGGSIEDRETSPLGAQPSADNSAPTINRVGGATGTRALDQFTIDLTQRARAGQIDPVLERDFEIRQVIDILTRRRQNNPILTGEAGVGKTAIVEGFALRIAEGDVPEPLKNVGVRTLDLGLLQAGAGVKGEFENRLKSVIEEVKSSPQPIILFIDEAHTMIGAGGQAGQSDAANLLKPALARGELRTIAATTWAEYKKYFEKDAALARRFQVVKVDEPTEEQGIIMMRGLTEMLENHHKVRILDEAVTDAVTLSHRYISGRQLPDKAISVLDTACARVALGQGATPPAIEDAQRRINQLTIETVALEREAITGTAYHERIEELKSGKAKEEERLARLLEQWEKEREIIDGIRDARTQLEDHALKSKDAGGVNETVADAPPAPVEIKDKSVASAGAGAVAAASAAQEAKTIDVDALRAELNKLNTELEQVQGEHPLMQACVDSQTIAEVISGWTGIPVGRMLTDEVNTILSLKERLEQRVIGQSHALEAIAQRIRTARARLTDPRRPVGVFLLVGPSGVGKTETALALAETLYGGERNLVTINMSEYQEAHTISSLKGSPPGYVGYGEGGVLTEAVRRKPYSVVLLDEVEKAHTDVMELFYQVFDKGMLEDAEGREIDFKNTIILLTSNVGTDTIMKLCADPGKPPEPEALTEAVRPQLLKVFKPALLGRMVTVTYYPISDEVMREIIKLQLSRVSQRLMENHGTQFSFDEAVVTEILNRCKEVESGARNVDHILTRTLLPEMSGEFLSRMASEQSISRVHVAVGDGGQFTYEIS